MQDFIDFRTPGPFAAPVVAGGRTYWMARSRRGVLKMLFMSEQDAVAAANKDDEALAEFVALTGKKDRGALVFDLAGQTVYVACSPAKGRLASEGFVDLPSVRLDVELETGRKP